MSLVFTTQGIAAINAAKTTGYMLELTRFKVTDGTADPLDTDTSAVFEADGTVHYTGTAASGQITNKRVIDANTFELDVIVPPEVPVGGGSFNIRKLGLYIDNPDPAPPPGQEYILIASTKFEGTFPKNAPTLSHAGNALVTTLVIEFNGSSEVLEVLDGSSRDWNHYAEYDSPSSVGNANSAIDRVYRITRAFDAANTGNQTYLLSSTKIGFVTFAEWVPDNHSLLFPIHALPTLGDAQAEGYPNTQGTLHLVFNSTTLDDADTHMMNLFPAVHDALSVSFFADAGDGNQGLIRQVTNIQQFLYVAPGDPANVGKEIIAITLTPNLPATPAVGQRLKLWVHNAALQPGSGGGSGGGLLGYDVTWEPVGNSIAQRAPDGSTKVETPTVGADGKHAANRNFVTSEVSAVSSALATHESDVNAHAALFTVSPGNDTVAKRTSNGQVRTQDPSNALDAANKQWTEAALAQAINDLAVQIQPTVETLIDDYLDTELEPLVQALIDTHNTSLAAHADLFSVTTAANKAVMRDANGKVQFADPQTNEEGVNLQYLTASLQSAVDTLNDRIDSLVDSSTADYKVPVINPTNPKAGDFRIDTDTEVGFRIAIYTTATSRRQLFPAQWI